MSIQASKTFLLRKYCNIACVAYVHLLVAFHRRASALTCGRSRAGRKEREKGFVFVRGPLDHFKRLYLRNIQTLSETTKRYSNLQWRFGILRIVIYICTCVYHLCDYATRDIYIYQSYIHIHTVKYIRLMGLDLSSPSRKTSSNAISHIFYVTANVLYIFSFLFFFFGFVFPKRFVNSSVKELVSVRPTSQLA